MNENLPTFVVLPDRRGFASNGPKNWSSAFLPAMSQGTIIRPGTPEPVTHLFPPKSAEYLTPAAERDAGELLAKLNGGYAEGRKGDSRLEARIQSYEMAARMQIAAPEALNLSREPDYIRAMYGLSPDGTKWPKTINWKEEADYFGRKCLSARRLLAETLSPGLPGIVVAGTITPVTVSAMDGA